MHLLIHLCLRPAQLRRLIFSPLSHFLSAFVSCPTSFLPFARLLCEDKADTHSHQNTNSSSCLHHQFILAVTGQRKWTPLHESFSFPLNYTTRNESRNSSHTSHWKTEKKKSRESMLSAKGGKKKSQKNREGLENFAQIPKLQTCNQCAAIKMAKKTDITWWDLSAYFVSFLSSLFSWLPPFSPTSWDRFTWDVSYGSVSPARLPDSLWLPSTVDEISYTITEILLCGCITPRCHGPHLFGFLGNNCNATNSKYFRGTGFTRVPFAWIIYNIPVSLCCFFGEGCQGHISSPSEQHPPLVRFSPHLFSHSVSTPHSLSLCQHHQISNTEESE